MKKKLFTLLTLLLCVCSGAWATQTIDGVTVPNIPESSLDMGSQTTYNVDANGWIVFNPYDVAAKWWAVNTKSAQTENYTKQDGDGFTAPFVTQTSSTQKINSNGNYAAAIRFTGVTDASFLVNPRGNRNVIVALYTYDGENQTLCDSKACSNGAGFKEILFSSLSSSTNYVAYIYTKATSNCTLAEIALKKTIDTTPAAVSITSPASDPDLVEITQGKTTTLSIIASGYPAPEYQWYRNTSKSTTGATEVTGANNASYETPSDLAVGTWYYYCVADNTSGDPAISPFFSVKVNALGGDLTVHEPGVYQKAANQGGYGQTLAERTVETITRQYEIYAMGSASSANYWFAGTRTTTTTDANCLSSAGFSSSGFTAAQIKGGWMKGSAVRGTSYSFPTNGFDEFPEQSTSCYTARTNSYSSSMMIKVSGYDQFSILAKDNNATASNGKHFVVKVNGVEQDMTLSTSYSIRRFTLDAGATNVIEITGSSDTGNNDLAGFSLRLPLLPTLSVSPTSAEDFTYVYGSSTSTAQEFTVTGSNLTDDDITVSLQAGSDYYEISSDNSTFGTSNLTVASGNKVYVRLKAGLAKNSYYAGTLRFANDGADDVDIALSGSVTGQTYEITKGSATNGSIEVASSAEGDATVDISAAGNTGYEFSSWNIYKTGEPATTISPAAATASTTFTMPAYAVTVDATFAAKTYTVTLNNQSATTAGTESVTTTYNANTNLTTNITCPTKTDYVFMGYYTAADGEGKRLIDNSGAWIASVDGYTDASKNWIKDGSVTLYACWMKYATSADFNVYAYANIPREKTGVTSTSTDFSYLSNKNISYTFGNNTALDHSKNANFIGLKMKNSTDYIKFAVESGKQVTVIFGRANADPKLYIDGTESTIDLETSSSTADNQVVYYVSTSADRLFKIESAGNTLVIKKIFIEDASTTSVTATVGANGYTTFTSPYALDLTDANRPEGLKAYAATLDGANLTFTELKQVVPAGTGLLLQGEAKGYNIPVVAAAGTAPSNALIGINEVTPMKSTADDNYFFVMKKASTASDALKFAPLTIGSTAVNVPAGKVVVEVPNDVFTSNNSRELTISFDNGGTTGINGLDNLTNSQLDNNAPMYNLAGQKVGKSYKGIVIVNGKKVVRK